MNKYRFAATGYIIHNNSVLLIKHPKLGVWLPVGGKVDEGEHPENSFIREVREEVGLDVEIIKTFEHPQKIGSHRYLQLEKVGDCFHLDFIYYAKSNSQKLILNEKVKEARWFSFFEFLKNKELFFKDVSVELEKIYAHYCEYDPFQIVRAEYGSFGKIFNRAIVVNHSDEKTYLFLKEISRYAKNIFYIEKEYSGNTSSKKKIISLIGKKNIIKAEDALKILEKSTIDDVVFEMSGVLSEKLNTMSNWKGFLIENTANGLLWAKNVEKLNKPLFSIAYSRLKKSVENPHVADSVFSSLIEYFHLEQRNIYGLNILLVGYGSIGSLLADSLSLISEKITVYDIDYAQILRAKAHRFQVIGSLENISHFDMIIASTGTPNALKSTDILMLKNGTILVNCSTKQWEFDRDFIKKQNIKRVGDTEIVKLGDKHIEILNHGFPINFWNSHGTYTPPILSTFACMLEASIYIAKNRNRFSNLQNKIYEISEILPNIENKYLKHYFLKLTS